MIISVSHSLAEIFFIVCTSEKGSDCIIAQLSPDMPYVHKMCVDFTKICVYNYI